MKKIAKPSSHSTTQRCAAPLIPQQGQQGSGIEPEAYQELLDAGYIIVNRQEALGAGSSDGSSTTSGRGITSLFSRGFSAGTGGPEVASRRDRTKDEFAETKLELERCRNELELSKGDLQRAVGDNRVFSRNIRELQIANARLKEDLLRSQHELANVQRKFDDATFLADARGRELQATQAMVTDANSLGRQNSSAYKSGLHFQ